MMMMMATCEACGVFGLACRLDLASFNPSFLLPLPSHQEPLALLAPLSSDLLSCLSTAAMPYSKLALLPALGTALTMAASYDVMQNVGSVSTSSQASR